MGFRKNGTCMGYLWIIMGQWELDNRTFMKNDGIL